MITAVRDPGAGGRGPGPDGAVRDIRVKGRGTAGRHDFRPVVSSLRRYGPRTTSHGLRGQRVDTVSTSPVIKSPTYSGPDRRQQPRWRPRPLRVLLMLLLLSAIGYGAAVMWLIGEETRLVFRAGSTLATGRPPFPYEQIEIPREDGAVQFAWA